MKPYTRIGVVALVFLVAGTIPYVTAAISERDPAASITELHETIVPNADLVGSIRSGISTGQGLYAEAAFAEPDARAKLFTEVAGTADAVKEAIRELDARPVVLPGEKAIRAQVNQAFEHATDTATAAGFLIVQGSLQNADPAAQAEFTVAFSNAIAAFSEADDALSKYEHDYEVLVASTLDEVAAASARTRTLGFGLGAFCFLLAFVIGMVMWFFARREYRALEVVARRREAETERNDFENRLQRALDLADNEDEVYPVVGEALATTTDGHFAEVLLADSSRAHFRRVAATASDTALGCHVSAPDDCPAARRGQPIVFSSSDSIDACRHLRNRPDGACSAICNPVRIAGGTLGVVHVTGPADALPTHDQTALVDLITRKTAERVGMLRAFSQAETQARTDALTGLLNRRSLESEVTRLIHDGDQYVVAYGDLDLFKHLNDVHGHAAGDRALRVIARALRDSVRPSDIVARYGGEEFLIVLPNCDAALAKVVVERVRIRFREYLAAAAAPEVTISFGIASGDRLSAFDDVVARADAALLTAKAGGRDRVVIEDQEPPVPPSPPVGELRAI